MMQRKKNLKYHSDITEYIQIVLNDNYITPSRMDKRVAPDKEGAADKQCLRRRKTLIPNRCRWSSLSLFRQIHLGEGKL